MNVCVCVECERVMLCLCVAAAYSVLFYSIMCNCVAWCGCVVGCVVGM